METTHTPGPWGLRHSGKTVVSLPQASPGAREVIACSIENPANARLIAAAPELLDTFQAIRNDAQAFLDGKSDIDPYELAEAIRSACEVSIARATQP